MDRKWFRAAISLTAGGIAATHVFVPQLAIDGVTALLLVVGIVPWLQPLFKSVELPGGLKVEFQEMQQIESKARAAGLVDSAPQARSAEYSFQLVADTDPNLALAGLRIELERRLQALAETHGYDGRPRGIGNLLRHLEARDLLTHQELGAIRDIVQILNEAVHGATVAPAAATLALDFGERVLATLDARSRSQSNLSVPPS